jgi:hypothetical protein
MGALTQPSACWNVDGHPVALTGPLNRTLLTDGSGWFGAVDLPPGEYWLSTEIPTPTLTITQPATIVAGIVTEQDISLPPCVARTIYLPVVLKYLSP